MRSTIAFLELALALAIAAGTYAEEPAPWHHPLYIGGGGYWQARAPVEVINDTDRELAGVPVSVPI